jgi:hypothetical protein
LPCLPYTKSPSLRQTSATHKIHIMVCTLRGKCAALVFVWRRECAKKQVERVSWICAMCAPSQPLVLSSLLGTQLHPPQHSCQVPCQHLPGSVLAKTVLAKTAPPVICLTWSAPPTVYRPSHRFSLKLRAADPLFHSHYTEISYIRFHWHRSSERAQCVWAQLGLTVIVFRSTPTDCCRLKQLLGVPSVWKQLD